MSTREAILDAVRGALGHKTVDGAALRRDADALLADLPAIRPDLLADGLVEAFIARLVTPKVAATAERIGDARELPAAVARYVEARGLPAAIAAKLRHPDRIVVCFAGDGDVQMTVNDFQTAVQNDTPLVAIVVNNGVHGTIRMHQERHYPDRHVATDITSPDYAALARAHGGHGESVTRTAGFAPAFERALASGKPAIIDVAFDREAISPAASLSEVKGKGRR